MSYKSSEGASKRSSLFFKKRRLSALLWIGFWTAVFSAILLIGAVVWYMRHYAVMDAHLFSLYLRGQARNSVLTTKDEAESIQLYTAENRIYVSYDRFPKHLPQAFLAIEDQRFYRHHGVDWKRSLGAAGQFLLGRQSYGGSTVTQQLIKNITGESEVSLPRKLKEIGRALELEKSLSKQQILEIYLNTVYLSHRCYGVQSAANYYFGCDVSQLTLPQCASLAAIIQAPGKWDPLRHPKEHLSRRNLVLYKMWEQGMISQTEYDDAVAAALDIVETPQSILPILPWYAETAVQEATELLCSLYEMEETQARRLLYTGGLTVITACDPAVQQTLESIYQSDASFPKTEDSLIQPQSACVVLDPHNGAILGIVGSRGKKEENRILNYATDTLRPPGSALKPLSVYAPAMEAGQIHAATVYDDTPYDFVTSPDGWPHNYPKGYRGLTTVQDAVSRSVNTVAVKILADYGIDRSFSFLRDRVHLSSLVDAVGKGSRKITDRALAPLALGQLSYGVSVKELTAGYTVFTDGGCYHTPFAVWEIRDGGGTTLFARDPVGERVLSEENAQAMTQILKTVTTCGTASRLKLAHQMDVAGKTGTTSDDCDRWFVGYTADYLCGVWFGYATPRSLEDFSETTSPALAVWDAVMTRLEAPRLKAGIQGKFQTDLLIRSNYCKDSGKLLTASCTRDPRGTRVGTAYFTAAQLPHTGCDCHVDVLYDTECGGVCLGGCDGTHLRLFGMLRIPHRDFPRQVLIADAQYVYRPLGDTTPATHTGEPFFATTIPQGRYVGISPGKRQFNCACYDHWYAWHFPFTVEPLPLSEEETSE